VCGGIDHLLAQHIAHLFIRDPVSLFREKIDLDDTIDTDHFEVAYVDCILSLCGSSVFCLNLCP